MLTPLRDRLTDYRQDWDGVALWAVEASGDPLVLRVARAALERLEDKAGLSPSALARAADRHAVVLLAVAAVKLPFTDRAEIIRIEADDLPG